MRRIAPDGEGESAPNLGETGVRALAQLGPVECNGPTEGGVRGWSIYSLIP
jgi:hypothetical protein